MRLKQLELVGFKSFVHRTVLDFPPGITAVVGPNGCGKSNIVDAIRWVLGEQSPKHLRGDSMEDVIFNGNERVAPTGMAQVSLTFENDPAVRPMTELDLDVSTIPAHFRELTEIQVTRRYFRSGESEYFINKTPCRLKDITELFLGTGVGSKAYAIIEQGRVEQLINAKPEDRRLFIEEAAGTTLYRSRKLAAERKMERTRENLLRAQDVLRELERQIQYLHRLAKKAEQYRELQSQVRQLEVALASVQWRELAAAAADMQRQLADAREQEAAAVAAIAQLEAERTAKLEAQASAEEQLARCRERAAGLEAELQSLHARRALLQDQIGERERRRERLAHESQSLSQQHSEVQQALQRDEREREESGQLLLFDESELQRKEAELAAAREQVAAAAHALDAAKNAVVALVGREVECRNGIAAHTRRREDAARRLQRLAAEHADAAERLATLERTIADRRTQVQQLQARLQSAKGTKEQLAERIRVLAEERRAWERQTTELHGRLVQLRSRFESLREIQRNYEGYQRGVRSVLLTAQPDAGVLGVVADVFDVPEQYERAVAAALGDRLQYVIVRQTDDGVGAVGMLRAQDSGRGSFIPLSPRQVKLNGNGAASLNGCTRPLREVISVDSAYGDIADTLLGEVVLVPDLDTGLALWRKNGVHVTMVTPDGDVIDANGVITGGSERPMEEEIVARRRQATELAAEIIAIEEQLARAGVEGQRLEAELDTLERTLKDVDRDTHQLTVEIVGAEKDVERLEGEQPRWIDRLEVIRFESEQAATEEGDATAELERADGVATALAAERVNVEAELSERQDGAHRSTEALEHANRELTDIKVRVAERRQRREAAAEALRRHAAQRDEVFARGAAVRDELQQTAEEHAALGAAVQEADAQRQRLDAERAAIDTELGAARTGVEQVATAVAAHDHAIHDTRERLDGLRTACTQFDLGMAEKRLRAEHIAQTIAEKYAIDLATTVPDPDVEALDQSDAAARLESLRDKLSRIGEVNVGAIDELRELEERAQFLRTQKADLEQSLADLERTIHKLNRASRTKFAETFAAVNEKFQTVLPRLFRGGEARLVLTDEHNLLETGVEIVVRPPGKRLDTVTLLSGGEKALVAVSLIFSLFLINPTPFCFLDEVDAPLDDANIGRFTGLVEEMSAHSQFIVITHNKRTMQAAGVLYGVTMQEPGVSKLVSVAMH